MIVVIGTEVMLRGLFVDHLINAAADVEIVSGASLAEVTPAALPESSVLVFLEFSSSTGQILHRIRQARDRFPSTPIAVISDYQSPDIAEQYLELGVRGCISTSQGVGTLVHSLRTLMAGGEVLSLAFLTPRTSLGPEPLTTSASTLSVFTLTATERRVLSLARAGKSTRLIAAELGLDEREVKGRMRALMRKTGTRNRIELATARIPQLDSDDT